MTLTRAVLALVFVALFGPLAACHTPGKYGHAIQYAEESDETAAFRDARQYDPVDFSRRAAEWRKKPVSLFGVVESRLPGSQGRALLKIGVRRLEPRNWCANDKNEDTCLVTVSYMDFGIVYALVELRGDDDTGPKSVGAQSLIRITGVIGEEINSADGAPIIHATYLRHWPVHFYITRDDSKRPPHQ